MAKRLIETFGGRPLLDIASYARRGPDRRDRLGPEEIALISRTVSRTPEVVVKVLTRGGHSLKAVRAHLAYLNRGGELEIETDQGEWLAGDGVDSRLVKDWDLDIEEQRGHANLRARKERSAPKLVHKILFSMPPGTSSSKVLKAVQEFARDEFGLRHRYVMVLHTDEPHPHVHMVVKAMSEQGVRLHIRKETLRRWRAEFARNLRALGIPANATDRQVRGVVRPQWRDAIFRAAERGDSRVLREKIEGRGIELPMGTIDTEGRLRLLHTREDVERGWRAVAELANGSGLQELATAAKAFLSSMPATKPDREYRGATYQATPRGARDFAR